MNKTLLSAALAGGIAAATAVNAHAQSNDALLNKLVSKGLLTQQEADELKKEADAGFDKAYRTKSGLPPWVTSLKIGGDLRLRYEGIYIENGDVAERNRFRYRLRPGITATLKDNFEVGLRLTSSEASGSFGGDPISGNTSFSDNASKKFIYIDLAYAKWTALNNSDWTLVFTGGKMENPLHFPSTDVFDKDYTPEGFAQEITYRLNPNHSFKLTGAQYILDELETSGDDPLLLGAQLGWTAVWNKKLSSYVGATYLTLIHSDSLITANIPNQGRGNTRTAGGALVHEYEPIIGDARITYTFDKVPLYPDAFPVSISGDYIYNPSPSDENTGYSVGFTLGKAGKKHTWQLDYRYTYLGGDAWFEEFPESDFGAYYESAPIGGSTGYRYGTNIKGHWVKGAYAATDALTLSIAYFFTDLVHPNPHGSDSGAGRLQADLVWKF
jgi:hypothetical protein